MAHANARRRQTRPPIPEGAERDVGGDGVKTLDPPLTGATLSRERAQDVNKRMAKAIKSVNKIEAPSQFLLEEAQDKATQTWGKCVPHRMPKGYDFDREILSSIPREPLGVTLHGLALDHCLNETGVTQTDVRGALRRLQDAGYRLVFRNGAEHIGRIVSVAGKGWEKVQKDTNEYWQRVYETVEYRRTTGDIADEEAGHIVLGDMPPGVEPILPGETVRGAVSPIKPGVPERLHRDATWPDARCGG